MGRDAPLVVRWTVGDVSAAGFEVLRLSIIGAARLFGPLTRYVVCVNSVDVKDAAARVGDVGAVIEWRSSTQRDIPRFLRKRFDSALATSMGWKFAPVRLAGRRFELSLDNDCVLWRMPQAIRAWLGGGKRCVLAEDVRAGFGQFAGACGSEPRNAGLRGLVPRMAFGRKLGEVLATCSGTLTSELDEQGLQVAAIRRHASPLVVTTGEVSICSPFPPHQHGLGTCGAHFVGLNVTVSPFTYQGRLATDWLQEHWSRLKDDVAARVSDGLSPR